MMARGRVLVLYLRLRHRRHRSIAAHGTSIARAHGAFLVAANISNIVRGDGKIMRY